MKFFIAAVASVSAGGTSRSLYPFISYAPTFFKKISCTVTIRSDNGHEFAAKEFTIGNAAKLLGARCCAITLPDGSVEFVPKPV